MVTHVWYTTNQLFVFEGRVDDIIYDTVHTIDPSKVRDAILQGVQNYWDERAAIAITHTNYYKEW